MEPIPSEMLRGHMDTIILLSLVNEDKHTNQIREEIESRADGKFELKQGTFYSCLQRIVKQGYVTEYRSTSEDGTRRKFYQLTEKGKIYIDENKDKWEFSRSLINTLIKTPEKIVPKEPEVEAKSTQKKSEPAKESFDIDKVLLDFLTSDDTNSDSDIKKSDSENKTESIIKPDTEPDFSSENVTIIPFSNITAESRKDEDSTTIVSEPVSKSEQKVKIETPMSDYATSPEAYDLFTLMGIGEPEVAEVKSEASPIITSNSEESTKERELVATEASTSVKQSEAIETKSVAETKTESTALNYSTETKTTESVESNKLSSSTYNEDEDDLYTGSVISHDYKSILEKLFPQQKKQHQTEIAREAIYVEGTDINTYFPPENTSRQETTTKRDYHETKNSRHESVQQKKPDTKTERHHESRQDTYEVPADREIFDFSDIKSLANADGFKVSISTNATKRKVNSILVNKLVAISCLVFYAIIITELILLGYFTAPVAGLTMKPFIITAISVAVLPFFSLIIYFIDPKRKVGSLPTMKSIIELCIVIMLNLVIIMIVFAILSEIDFSSNSQLMKYIFYPSILILNIPVYFIIKYLLLGNRKFYG